MGTSTWTRPAAVAVTILGYAFAGFVAFAYTTVAAIDRVPTASAVAQLVRPATIVALVTLLGALLAIVAVRADRRSPLGRGTAVAALLPIAAVAAAVVGGATALAEHLPIVASR